jgi:hypothetical protein
MPNFVGKVGIGSHDVDLRTSFLELGIVICCIFYFCGAVECESGRHKDQDRPFAFEGFVRDLDKFAVMKSLGLKWLNLGIDKRHGNSFLWLIKTIE